MPTAVGVETRLPKSMHKNGVCVLTPKQAHEVEMNGTAPVCLFHHHISRGKAKELIEDSVSVLNEAGYPARLCDVRWVGKGKKFIVFERARSWKRVPSGPGNVPVMQLVPAGGSW